jgi:capsular exopolysaccharide synthesis family protein
MQDSMGHAELNLRDYTQVLRHRKLTIILTVIVIVGGVLAASFLQQPIYEATASVLVTPRTPSAVLPNSGNTEAVNIDREISIFESRAVRTEIAERLGRSPQLSATAASESGIIEINARSSSAERAAREANVAARSYIAVRRQQAVDDYLSIGEEVQARIDRLDEQLAALDASAGLDPDVLDAQAAERQQVSTRRGFYVQQLDALQFSASLSEQGGAQLISPASTPSSPVEPTPLRNGVIALVLGLVLGVILAFVREYMDDSLKTKEDVERVSHGAAVLALIPAVAGWKDRGNTYVVTLTQPRSQVAEAYRGLRTSVQFLGIEEPIRTLQVTSTNASEGKTTTLANLAVAFAQAGQSVIAVCCDLRKPRIHEFFDTTNEVGFTSVLLGKTPLSDAIQRVDGAGRLALLASGPPPPNPAELLAWPRAGELLEGLTAQFDLVLVDTPPVLPVTDALVVAGWVDATLLVVSAGTTTKKGLGRSVELLRQVDAPLLGTVLNGAGSAAFHQYGAGGYGYGYGYGYGHGHGNGNGEEPRSGRARGRQKSAPRRG